MNATVNTLDSANLFPHHMFEWDLKVKSEISSIPINLKAHFTCIILNDMFFHFNDIDDKMSQSIPSKIEFFKIHLTLSFNRVDKLIFLGI